MVLRIYKILHTIKVITTALGQKFVGVLFTPKGFISIAPRATPWVTDQ